MKTPLSLFKDLAITYNLSYCGINLELWLLSYIQFNKSRGYVRGLDFEIGVDR